MQCITSIFNTLCYYRHFLAKPIDVKRDEHVEKVRQTKLNKWKRNECSIAPYSVPRFIFSSISFLPFFSLFYVSTCLFLHSCHSSLLFSSVLFSSVLYSSVLFSSVLFCSLVFSSVLFIRCARKGSRCASNHLRDTPHSNIFRLVSTDIFMYGIVL